MLGAIIKAFIKVLRFSKNIYPELQARACNFLLALLQMEERCWSKLYFEPIMIPSDVLFVLLGNEKSPIDTLVWGFVLQSK